jgi:hypothetical protein
VLGGLIGFLIAKIAKGAAKILARKVTAGGCDLGAAGGAKLGAGSAGSDSSP